MIAQAEASQVLADAKRRSETLLKEADLEVKDRLFKMKSEFDAETKETRSELRRLEKRLIHKEENIDRKIEQFDKRDRAISQQEKQLIQREKNIEQSKHKYNELIEEQKRQLEKISGLSVEQAKEQLVEMLDNDELDEVVALLAAMPDSKSGKIMAEFKLEGEREQLYQIIRRIRQGYPDFQLPAETQNELSQPGLTGP